MRLGQVALMAGEVGCICELKPAPASAAPASAAPASAAPGSAVPDSPPTGAGASTIIMMHDRSQAEKYERSAR